MPLRVREFMPLVLERATERLPAELRHFDARIRFVWLQIHYWTPKIHYEVWLTRKTGRIEIGLHFEGEREFSYRWAEVIAAPMPELQARPRAACTDIHDWKSKLFTIGEIVNKILLTNNNRCKDYARRYRKW